MTKCCQFCGLVMPNSAPMFCSPECERNDRLECLEREILRLQGIVPENQYAGHAGLSVGETLELLQREFATLQAG